MDGRRLVELGLDAIAASPFQPRSPIDDATLTELAASIRESGVMQPVLVRETKPDRFELVAGERRWRAARHAGLDRVPAIVVQIDDEEAAAWALVENVQREDLNAMERARALRAMSDRFGLSHGRIAERVGLDRSTVTNLMRLMELEPEIQSLLEGAGESSLRVGHAKAILALPPGAERVTLARRAAREGWSVRRLESHAASPNERPGARPPTPGGPGANDAIERQVGETLGTKVRVMTNKGRTKGRLVIEFYSVEHFESLMERFGVELDV